MAIGDWFRKKAQPPAAPAETGPAARRFHDDRARMFDIQGTHMLEGLFQLPAAERDWAWQRAFWDHSWTASVALAEPQVFTGPDGFPYLRLNVPGAGAFDSQCLGNLAEACLQNLIGAAFFASPDAPPEAAQYVLSLGTIDSLVRYDSPDGDPVDLEEASLPESPGMFEGDGAGLRVAKAHDVLMGTPSADYLPPHLARSLYQHLTQGWGMEEPRVRLLIDQHMRPHRSLMISRSPSEFPEGAPVDVMAQSLMWHLNPGRRLMLRSEDMRPEEMTPLRDLFEGR